MTNLYVISLATEYTDAVDNFKKSCSKNNLNCKIIGLNQDFKGWRWRMKMYLEAIKYYNDVIKKNKKYKIPSTEEKKVLEKLIQALDKCNDEMKPEDIQTQIYTVGKDNGYKENLRDWFKLIYQVLFGDIDGPRMGFFISFFGVQETIKLIRDKIN